MHYSILYFIGLMYCNFKQQSKSIFVLFSQQFVIELTLTYARAIQTSTGVFKIEKIWRHFLKCGTFGRYFGILLRIIDLFRLIASIKRFSFDFSHSLS